MQWTTFFLIFYAVGAVVSQPLLNWFIRYCGRRSLLDDHEGTGFVKLFVRMAQDAAIKERSAPSMLIDLVLWPVTLFFWGVAVFFLWRIRAQINADLNGEFRRLDRAATDGFDVARDAHTNPDLQGPGITAMTIVVTVDGHTGFSHWLSKQKLDDLWQDKGEIGAFLKDIAAVAATERPQPKLELVRSPEMRQALEKAIGIANLCFFGKVESDNGITPCLVCFPVTGGDYMYLPLFKSEVEGRQKLGAIGLDVDKVGLVAASISDPGEFLTSLAPLAPHGKTNKMVRVRVITNMRKLKAPAASQVEGEQWCWDTICELAPSGPISRDEGPTNHPPAA